MVSPIQVDDGPSEDSIEPRDRVLCVTGFSIGGQRLHQTLLHDIFGDLPVAESFAGESNENIQVLQDGNFDARHGRKLSGPGLEGKVAGRDRELTAADFSEACVANLGIAGNGYSLIDTHEGLDQLRAKCNRPKRGQRIGQIGCNDIGARAFART